MHIMRTNIEIDDELMEQAMRAGPHKTKKEAVVAGLKLLARQAAYREILKWEGKLKWEGDDHIDWSAPADAASSDVEVTERQSSWYMAAAKRRSSSKKAASRARR